MKSRFVIVGCVAVFALSACGSGNEPEQSSATTDESKTTVFDGYVRDMKKAQQVEGTVKAANEKLKERIDTATQTDSGH